MFSESTMNKLSIVNGFISQIAMTFISNALTSVISLFLSNIKKDNKEYDGSVSVEIFSVMNYFSKKSFSSISNLFIPTSIIGALFIRLYGMKKVQIVTCLLQSICLILLSIISGLRQNLLYLILCWLIFLFGIGAVSQISLRNAALHYRQYQGSVAMGLVILGDLVITVVGFICQGKFPTNNNRKLDDLIIVFLLYLIPMWISLFITFYADFEKDPIDNTQQQQITLNEYIDELKSIYKYENLAKIMLLEFGITILSYFLVQIVFSYSDYFAETSNHCLHLNQYNNLQLIRNCSWLGCIIFAYLIDRDLSFKAAVRFINFAGLILALITIILSFLKDMFIYLQIIFLIQYTFICSFYSAILGKTLKIFSPAKMMEVTGFIGIAPAIVKLIRMFFEEIWGNFLGNEIREAISNHCDKIDNTKAYTIFGAWIYYNLYNAKIFYCIAGFISILLNIYAIYYIKFVPETQVPFDKASIKDLEQKPEDVRASEIKFQTETRIEEED